MPPESLEIISTDDGATDHHALDVEASYIVLKNADLEVVMILSAVVTRRR